MKGITKLDLILGICKKNKELDPNRLKRLDMSSLACIYDLVVIAPKPTPKKRKALVVNECFSLLNS